MSAEWISFVQRTVRKSKRSQPLVTAWQWLTVSGKKMLTVRENRRLRVTESVSLGDRRFIVLLEADDEHYLVGASAAGVTLLTRLERSQSLPAAASVPPNGEALCPPESTLGVAVLSEIAKPREAQDEQRTAGGHAQAEATDLLSGIPRAGGGPSQSASVRQAGDSHTKVPNFATGSVFPIASSGLRRHAFPVGRALIVLLALLPTLSVRPLLGQAQGTSATKAAATAPAANTAAARTPAARTAPQSKNNASGLSLTGLGSSSAPWTIVVLLTVLTLIPSLMICMTPFARLLVVFHFLRQALGLQTTPSNQTLIGLSLILTFFIMEPLGKQIYNGSFIPLQNGQITALEAVDRGSEPLRHFMAHYVREKDAALFLEIAHAPRPKTIDDVSLRVLMPAYIVSELKAGFQIGAVLFLPFLVVDIVIASITTSVGMMQLPPVVISTPLKLMLFLMVDGWHLLIGALVRSFY